MTGLLAGAGEARAQTEAEHWSATLTRGIGGGQTGYVAAAGGDSAVGMLDPSTFTYDRVSYTVNRLGVATSAAILGFETTPDLPGDAALVLRVPTFRTSGSATCPVGGTADFDLDSGSASSSVTGRYEWALRSTGTCVESDQWDRDLATTGTVKLVVSTDATLSGLAVNGGGTDLTLSPPFAADMYAYAASVGYAVAEVTLTPTKGDDEAGVAYLDADGSAINDADSTEDGSVAWRGPHCPLDIILLCQVAGRPSSRAGGQERDRCQRRTRAVAAPMSPRMRWMSAWYWRPRSVRRTPRWRRWNSGARRWASSTRMRWATAAAVTCSSSAARTKLSCRAAASKKRRHSSGGRACMVVVAGRRRPALSHR